MRSLCLIKEQNQQDTPEISTILQASWDDYAGHLGSPGVGP